MPTECSQDSFDFGTVEGRSVVGAFDCNEPSAARACPVLGTSSGNGPLPGFLYQRKAKARRAVGFHTPGGVESGKGYFSLQTTLTWASASSPHRVEIGAKAPFIC
jgi:hypothetical protein